MLLERTISMELNYSINISYFGLLKLSSDKYIPALRSQAWINFSGLTFNFIMLLMKDAHL